LAGRRRSLGATLASQVLVRPAEALVDYENPLPTNAAIMVVLKLRAVTCGGTVHKLVDNRS
jgi:hypothetical protein